MQGQDNQFDCNGTDIFPDRELVGLGSIARSTTAPHRMRRTTPDYAVLGHDHKMLKFYLVGLVAGVSVYIADIKQMMYATIAAFLTAATPTMKLLLLPFSALASATCAPTATIASGPIVGVARTIPHAPPVNAFLGVPFGQASRFELAAAASPWTKPLNATTYGPSCPQMMGGDEDRKHNQPFCISNPW